MVAKNHVKPTFCVVWRSFVDDCFVANGTRPGETSSVTVIWRDVFEFHRALSFFIIRGSKVVSALGEEDK